MKILNKKLFKYAKHNYTRNTRFNDTNNEIINLKKKNKSPPATDKKVSLQEVF